jgi:asparaginyl-tRNA synthetase
MSKMTVLAARQPAAIGSQVMIQGWVRTRRDSKGGFSFIEINDGSCMANLQIIADADLENYESSCSPTRGSVLTGRHPNL